MRRGLASIPKFAGFTLIAAILGGCVSRPVASAVLGPDRLQAAKVYYVVRHDGDDYEIHKLITRELRSRGFEAYSGPADERPDDAAAIVVYEDRWMWDLSMYLLTLKIDIRDGRTNTILASAQSYRPSMQRLPPDKVVPELMGLIFADSSLP
jgi:hypothetical protein